MKKVILVLLLLSSTVFANEIQKFFNASNDNYVICRAAYETYIKLSQNNASIKKINGSLYFQYKQEDYYFPLTACNKIKKTDNGLIF